PSAAYAPPVENAVRLARKQELSAQEEAVRLRGVGTALARLLEADALVRAGRPAAMPACLDAAVGLLSKGDPRRAEQVLRLLAELEYWSIGGESELWEGPHRHPLTRLWGAWVECRRTLVKSGGLARGDHQREVFGLLQSPDWRIPAAARLAMWQDCKGWRKEDLSAWAYHAVSRQFHRERNVKERDRAVARALETLKAHPDDRLLIRILDDRLQWECGESPDLPAAMETYRQLDAIQGALEHQRASWCVMLYSACLNLGRFDEASRWLDHAERQGYSPQAIAMLRKGLQRRRNAPAPVQKNTPGH
ncbi:MAG: hypothetical protein IJJ33_05885, partial [Victivallales bacterium]|nr:hypothetical protein [Victivallales bacterium]